MGMFGSRVLPPASELPGPVSDAVAAWREACESAARAQAVVSRQKRDAIPAAHRRDVELLADASEKGQAAPKVTNEQKARIRLAELERQAEAAELVQQRCAARVDERIEEHRAKINRVAEKKLAAARKAFLAGVDALEGALQELAAATALAAWATDPATSYKQRGGGPLLHAIPGPSGDPLTAAEAIAGLRQAFTPRPAYRIPSPFAVPVVEPEPAPDAPRQPDYAAELAAGSPPAA